MKVFPVAGFDRSAGDENALRALFVPGYNKKRMRFNKYIRILLRWSISNLLRALRMQALL